MAYICKIDGVRECGVCGYCSDEPECCICGRVLSEDNRYKRYDKDEDYYCMDCLLKVCGA